MCGHVRSCDKSKTYLHSQNDYSHRTCQCGYIPRGTPTYKLRMTPQLDGLVRSRDKLITLCLQSNCRRPMDIKLGKNAHLP